MVLGKAPGGSLDEWMEPTAAVEHFGRHPAKPAELRDHMGLISVAGDGGHLRPFHLSATAQVAESGLETSEFAVHLVDEVVQLPTGPTNMKLHWNVTSVYARVGGQWKIIHSHFSYVKGQLSAEAR